MELEQAKKVKIGDTVRLTTGYIDIVSNIYRVYAGIGSIEDAVQFKLKCRPDKRYCHPSVELVN